MFAKKLLQKATQLHNHHHHQQKLKGCLTEADLDVRIAVHYGIPSTASVLAFDPIQRLLAIGALDGRIKLIGGDNIEGLLISPKQLPYKYLEFLSNKGFLVSISNDNGIQVWDLESRSIACSLQWNSNITTFSVIFGSHFLYIGDEHGLMSVLKHDADNTELLVLPYHISAKSLTEAAGSSFPNHQTVVGVLPQPGSLGNRVLIAYESGLIILWDVIEARVVVVRGDEVLELKDGVDSPNQITRPPDVVSGQNFEEKEITALCWASSKGAILAAGYIDGDILFWKTSSVASSKGRQTGASSNNVVRLQLSSADRKLPVIVLYWSANSKSQNDGDGQLFIYGGDEIGSDEVLTVLSLEWSPGMETLRCVGRADITLAGSFADMILLPSATRNHTVDLLILTSPGRLQLFSHDSLSALASQKDKRITLSSLEFPAVIPTTQPVISAAKLSSLAASENSSRFLLEIATNMKLNSKVKFTSGDWPLTGGIVNQLSSPENYNIERIYLAGYVDGSVRIWDATSPVLSLLCVIEGEITGVEVTVSTAPVSELDFCSWTSGLAIGNQLGLIRVYNLDCSSKETSLRIVTGTKEEVHGLPEGGLNCRACFHLDSPVEALQYIDRGAKLAVAHGCGRVAVFDMKLLSVSFVSECLSSPSCPVISMTWTSLVYNDGLKSPKELGTKDLDKPAEKVMFTLTKDAMLYVFDGVDHHMINPRPMQLKKETTAISIHVIEGNISVVESHDQKASQDAASRNEPCPDITSTDVDQDKVERQSSPEYFQSGKDSLVLLCCKDALHLYHLKSVIQGNKKSICKVKLSKPCCWTSTFKKDEKTCGLVLLYQTGEVEVRSLPDLELVKETSLKSILRWNFKANLEMTMSSTEHGQIAMVNGCEVAFISLLHSDDGFRIPESFPCLHDKVLAAAVDAAISSSLNQKQKQGVPGVLGNIVKGIKGGRASKSINLLADLNPSSSNLDKIFSKNPFPDPSETITDNHEDVELDIDDIEIDEPVLVSSSSHTIQNDENVKKTDREKLLEGDNADVMPRLRTREEIIAKYRKGAGDAASVAGQARNKLLERQEKLEKISKRTEDLRNGAEDFASLADELVKVMERRKWWQI